MSLGIPSLYIPKFGCMSFSTSYGTWIAPYKTRCFEKKVVYFVLKQKLVERQQAFAVCRRFEAKAELSRHRTLRPSNELVSVYSGKESTTFQPPILKAIKQLPTA